MKDPDGLVIQLKHENGLLLARVKELEGELDIHIMQLAGISTVCIQNTETTVKDRITKENPYWTVAYGDVCVAVDREMRERKRAEEAELLAHYKDETATTFMNQVKNLQAQLHQRDTALVVAREALEHCLEASSDPPKYGRYMTKEDLEIVRHALSQIQAVKPTT